MRNFILKLDHVTLTLSPEVWVLLCTTVLHALSHVSLAIITCSRRSFIHQSSFSLKICKTLATSKCVAAHQKAKSYQQCSWKQKQQQVACFFSFFLRLFWLLLFFFSLVRSQFYFNEVRAARNKQHWDSPVSQSQQKWHEDAKTSTNPERNKN